MRRLCCRGSCEPKKQNTMDAFFCVSRCWRSAPTIPHRIGVSDWHLFSFFFVCRSFFLKNKNGTDLMKRPSVVIYCNYRHKFSLPATLGPTPWTFCCWNLHDASGRRCREQQTTQWAGASAVKVNKSVVFVNLLLTNVSADNKTTSLSRIFVKFKFFLKINLVCRLVHFNERVSRYNFFFFRVLKRRKLSPACCSPRCVCVEQTERWADPATLLLTTRWRSAVTKLRQVNYAAQKWWRTFSLEFYRNLIVWKFRKIHRIFWKLFF